jgi:mono/diheme cytochrome c family protein
MRRARIDVVIFLQHQTLLPDMSRSSRHHAVRFSLSVFAIYSFGLVVAAYVAPTKTIWDGVFTDQQASRGGKTYRQTCGHCHRDDLKGADGPALTGPTFLSSWNNETLTELVLKIGTTMPLNAPASLTAQDVVDIVAFVIQTNGGRPGESELPNDGDVLDNIQVTQKPQ